MRKVLLAGLLPLLSTVLLANDGYRKPPNGILDVLNAPPTPEAVVNPDGNEVLLIERILYPPIADLARPMARLAGFRIDTRNNGPHSAVLFRSIEVRSLAAGGSAIRVALPAGAKITAPIWSADGKQFAFMNMTDTSVELWIGDAAGQVRKNSVVRVNAALYSPRGTAPVHWMPDSKTLLVETVPGDRGEPPTEPAVPPGPHTQETLGKAGPAPTYEDLLKNPHDEDLFDYYATSQLVLVNSESGNASAYGKPGVFTTVDASPDGHNVLVARARRPYSYFHPLDEFAQDVEVWDGSGKVAYTLAHLPVADRVPIGGVPTGPREYSWNPTEPATLIWVEALDGGNPKEKVPHRDRVMVQDLQTSAAQPRELLKVDQRFTRAEFGESGTLLLVTDYDRDKRWAKTYALNPRAPGEPPKVIWSRNIQDRYKDPGTPEMRVMASGKLAMRQDGDKLLLSSLGATPEGDRPFLSRFDVKTGEAQQLFRCDDAHYEVVIDTLDDSGSKFLTRRESPTEPPNFYLHNADAAPVAITNDPDPTPELRRIKKQLVTYKRQDGVPLSFTLYLPPGYQPGTKLPTVLWAYPFEYNDPATAGQISGSTLRFTTITGPSELFFALAGYAVLDNAAMPVIGTPETVNNTYLDQIVMDAKAAIQKATEMGVTDPDRVGVGGHSYGAFMTANLMAHSSLFKAGIARSGAYNRTLTPFGFQTEHRTLWEAPDVYLKMSPFLSADKIKGALLLIHGEADDNTGTFPIQSERMYAAVRGNGGMVRLVTLPFEAHAYRARETTEDVLFEMLAWFDRYVKNSGGESSASASEMQ